MMTTTKTLQKSAVNNKKQSQRQPNTIALIFKTIFNKYRNPRSSCIYLRTDGTTPQAPQVGAVTIIPPAAFCSLVANAYEHTNLFSRVCADSSMWRWLKSFCARLFVPNIPGRVPVTESPS